MSFGGFALVFSILRVGHGKKFLHRFAGHAGFLVEHIDVAECYFQQRVGNFVERVEWGRTADRNRIDRWVADSYLLDGFPQFGKQ